MVITPVDMLLRMGASVALGGLVGYERGRTVRPAGLRTHLLVSLAAATFMLVSTQFVYFQHYVNGELVSVDTSRIASSVVTGVGFLGAGAILRTGISVQGLTTAASLWLVAAVGLAAGGGMFEVAVLATGIALFSLVILRRLEGRQRNQLRRRIRIVLDDDGLGEQDITERLESTGAKVTSFDYDRNVRTQRSSFSLDVSLPDRRVLESVLSCLEALPKVRRVQVERHG